jgi:hypothetical protein
MTRLVGAALIAAWWAVPGGCRSMPVYPWVDQETALGAMADRAARLTSVEGECRLLLTDEQGDAIRLDGALVARPPEHLRLRAWKLNQVAFDLLLTPDGLWLLAPDERIDVEALPAGPFVEAWLLAVTAAPGNVRVEDDGGAEFAIVGRPSRDGALTIRAVVDRATLLPRVYTLLDGGGAVVYTLQLDRYRSFDGVAWPTRLTGRAAGRTFVLEMTEPRFNDQPAPAAFEPPPGARRPSG